MLCDLARVLLHQARSLQNANNLPLWLDLMKRLGWAVNVVYSIMHIILIFRLYQIHMLLKIDAGRLSSSVSMIS